MKKEIAAARAEEIRIKEEEKAKRRAEEKSSESIVKR